MIPVSWTANDPDSDPLTFRILYSPDDGATWSLQAFGVTGSSTELDATNFTGGTIKGRFKVLASDGIHTGEDVSDDPITIANRAPTIQIASPETGASVAISQTIALEADAYDIDSGSLSGDQVQWSSDLDGPLGAGDQLSVSGLSLGRHLITAAAEDESGRNSILLDTALGR